MGLEQPAGIAGGAELQGEADPVLRPAAEPDVIEIAIAQDIVLQQGRLVDRQREQRAALYCRVSTADQSCERHAPAIRSYGSGARGRISPPANESRTGNCFNLDAMQTQLRRAHDKALREAGQGHGWK